MSFKGFFEARNLLNFFLYAVRILNMQNYIKLCIKFNLNIIVIHESHILRFKKAFLAHILESHMLILLIYGQKIIIFISIYIYKWGKESLILLAEKTFFSKNPQNDVQEGFQSHTTSYLGSVMLKMSKYRKIFF